MARSNGRHFLTRAQKSVPSKLFNRPTVDQKASTHETAGMLILVLVLKDSLMTFFKSLSLSWSLGVRSLSLSWSLGVWSLSLSWSLWARSLSSSWSLWSSPCPCPCFQSLQGLVSNIPLFRLIRILLWCQCLQLVLIILTCVFPAIILLCVYKYDVYGLAMFFCYNHRYYKAYNIYDYNTSLVFHLESSNANLK